MSRRGDIAPTLPSAYADYLVFELDKQQFAVSVASVIELIRAVAVSRLPKAPSIIEGVINRRGTVIALLDIRARFRLPVRPPAPADHFIIAWATGRIVAIRVDRAIDLLTVSDVDFDDASEAVSGSELISGVAKLSTGLVLIHDLDTFLSDAEAAALDQLELEGSQ